MFKVHRKFKLQNKFPDLSCLIFFPSDKGGSEILLDVHILICQLGLLIEIAM